MPLLSAAGRAAPRGPDLCSWSSDPRGRGADTSLLAQGGISDGFSPTDPPRPPGSPAGSAGMQLVPSLVLAPAVPEAEGTIQPQWDLGSL